MIHVLTADGSIARLYEVSGEKRVLREIADFGNSIAALHERDLVSSRPGRSYNRTSGSRQTFEASSEKQHLTHRWLSGVAQSLQPLLASRDCQCLILVASPRLLSEFRALLPKPLQKKVLVEYSRNLAGLPLTTLNIRLRPSVLSAVRLLAEGPMK
jgi:protein required for attachment to host cells